MSLQNVASMETRKRALLTRLIDPSGIPLAFTDAPSLGFLTLCPGTAVREAS